MNKTGRKPRCKMAGEDTITANTSKITMKYSKSVHAQSWEVMRKLLGSKQALNRGRLHSIFFNCFNAHDPMLQVELAMETRELADLDQRCRSCVGRSLLFVSGFWRRRDRRNKAVSVLGGRYEEDLVSVVRIRVRVRFSV